MRRRVARLTTVLETKTRAPPVSSGLEEKTRTMMKKKKEDVGKRQERIKRHSFLFFSFFLFPRLLSVCVCVCCVGPASAGMRNAVAPWRPFSLSRVLCTCAYVCCLHSVLYLGAYLSFRPVQPKSQVFSFFLSFPFFYTIWIAQPSG